MIERWSEIRESEWKVLRYLCDGHNNESIANQLGISPETVKAHLVSVFRKLGCNNRVEVVLKVLKRQLGNFDFQSH
jgi:DNA-binding NarL/FixJ family response regulator